MNGDIWQRIEELRGEGMNAQAAWRQAQAEFAEDGESTELPPDVYDAALVGKSCSLPHAVQWVADNLERKSVKVEAAPSATAWGLLCWAQSSPVCKAEFWKSIWSKMLPSKSELENQARYSDDGSKQIELAERILARIESQSVA